MTSLWHNVITTKPGENISFNHKLFVFITKTYLDIKFWDSCRILSNIIYKFENGKRNNYKPGRSFTMFPFYVQLNKEGVYPNDVENRE